MRAIAVISLVLAAISLCQADDDGQYHPELDNFGKHYSTYDGRYLAHRNAKYDSIYNGYQPYYYKGLNRDLLAPLVNYGDSVYQASFPSTATYRTPVPVPSTYQPFVYSTPKPVVYSTPKAIVYTTPKPVVYSSPKTVYSTPTPYTVSTKSPSAIYLKSVSDADASIVREDRTYDENNYHFAYETNNGIAAEESGIVDSAANGVGGGTRVRGFYEYIGDDGLKYRVDYVADENGYRASGAHLPKAP